jgi:uncharacterized Zn finger protein
MTEIVRDWTPEKVSQLAPDERSAKAGFDLAIVSEWLAVGRDTSTVWGEYQGSGAKPYQIKIDLLSLTSEQFRLGCSCPSRKQPCKHVLALLYLLVGTPEMIPNADAPDFVQQWREQSDQSRAQHQKKGDSAAKTSNSDQRTKSFIERKHKIMAGLEDLELWLDNMIRHGLGDPQVQNLEFWEAKAARIVDAQAPGIATWIRDMGKIPQRSTPDWIEDLLEQLGKLHLFIEGFKRFDEFSMAVQADLRTVAGWHLKRSDLADDKGYEDEWLVLGTYETVLDDRMRTQRIWLRGIHSGKVALIREFAFGDQAFDTTLQLGCRIHAELVYYPSAYPLRAFIRQTLAEPTQGRPISGESIRESVEKYSDALSQNPWLPQYPFLLAAVIPVRYPGQWILREVEGVYLPIVHNFDQRWSLLAVSGGHPMQVMGEWDGGRYLPTGAFAEGRFVDFNLIGKL